MLWNDLTFSKRHDVGDGDPRRFTEELARDPTQLSPFTTNVQRRGNVTSGRPIPVPGMDIGARAIAIRHEQGRDGTVRSTLDVEYSGAFSGPGRIVATRRPGQGMVVEDQWVRVRNNTAIPSRMVEVGHDAVSDLGFRNLASKTRR
jgi:hypothetical protein